MPKKSINVNNFSGGLDNNTNPRDLSDNQFKILNGLDNEIPGKLRLFGDIDAYDGFTEGSNFSQSQSTFYKGNGLTYLSFDRDVDSASKPSISQNELLLVNDAANENVYAYNLIDGSTSSALIDYGSDDSRINTFVVDGEVRLSSETTKTNNTPKWFGYIEKTYNMGNASATTAGGTNDIGHLYENYYASDLYIAPLKSSISSGSYDYDPENYFDKSFNLGVSEIVLNDGLTLTGTDSNGDITDSNLNTVAALNTKFSAVMTISEGHGTFALYSFFTNNATATDLGVGATNSNIRVYTSDQKVFYGLFASNVYGNQESYPVYIGDMLQPSISGNNQSYTRPLNIALAGRIPTNPRQTGIKIYWALINKDDLGLSVESVEQKYLLLDIDFSKGLRFGGNNKYEPMQIFTSTNKYYSFPLNPVANKFYTRRLLSLSQNEPYLNLNQSAVGRQGTGFKTSSIANRRAYIGNVSYYEGTDKVIKSDTVLKSDVNKFDTFRANNFIDVEVNDGDEITALESINNQLLQFKRNTLYIINISRDIEFLEGEYKFRGCEKDYHVVKGEGFVSWFNQSSVFLYDGQRVIDINLNETGQPRLANWRNDYYSNDAVIGYYPDKKSIFILNSEDNQLLQFDIKSQSWSFVDVTLANMSNIVTNNNGDMLFLQHSGSTSTLKKWDDTAFDVNLGNNGILLQTKELDFGNPDTNKNINTLYISYKQPNTERVQIKAIADSGSVIPIDTLEASSSFTTKKILMPAGFKGIKTFTLQVAQYGASAIDDEFEINDMQIIYRELVKR
jgi:hypothetical protein